MNALFKEFGVGTRSNEHDQIPLVVYGVDEQKVTTDVTFSMIFPVTRQLVIFQLGRQRTFIVDDQTDDLLQCDHIIAAGPRKTLPILLKLFGMA